jgi:hypothetical protein
MIRRVIPCVRQNCGQAAPEQIIVVILIALAVLVAYRLLGNVTGTRTNCAGQKIAQLGQAPAPLPGCDGAGAAAVPTPTVSSACAELAQCQAGLASLQRDIANLQGGIAGVEEQIAFLQSIGGLTTLQSNQLHDLQDQLTAGQAEVTRQQATLSSATTFCNNLALQCGAK